MIVMIPIAVLYMLLQVRYPYRTVHVCTSKLTRNVHVQMSLRCGTFCQQRFYLKLSLIYDKYFLLTINNVHNYTLMVFIIGLSKLLTVLLY